MDICAFEVIEDGAGYDLTAALDPYGGVRRAKPESEPLSHERGWRLSCDDQVICSAVV